MIDNQKLTEYVKFIVDKAFETNKYFNDQSPWSKKDDKKRLNTIMYVTLEIIRKISILLLPIIPNSSEKVLSCLNVNIKNCTIESINNNFFNKTKTKLNKMKILFKKIENK